MLIETPRHFETIGAVKLYDIQRVIKLDSELSDNPLFYTFSKSDLHKVLNDLSIVIPIKNERINLFDGALRSIPHNCPIIVVSNSNEKRCKVEKEVVKQFYNVTEHPIMYIHQKDPNVALAFKELKYYDILNGKGEFVRDGKGEGMIIGILVAKAIGSKYVGFVDADNYLPSSIYEYVLDFAAGIKMSKSPYSMVRLRWKYKPKLIKNKVYFKRWGRVSRVTNKFLNKLIGHYFGYKTTIMKTANSGEHAMSIELANKLAYSSGYSIEPFEIIYILENFGKSDGNKIVEIFQIETLNPHIHENKGKEHINNMIHDSLSTIYHSKLANKNIKLEIIEELKKRNVLKDKEEPKKNIMMSPIETLDEKSFIEIVRDSEGFIELR